jgi:hypothetical protein
MNQITSVITSSLEEQIKSGATQARLSFGGNTPAFAWAGNAANSAIAHVTTGTTDSMSAIANRIVPIDEVTAWTTGDKPITAGIDARSITLKTYPGVASISTAAMVDSANIGAAVAASLHRQAQRALDADFVASVTADSTPLAKAATIQTIVEAQGLVYGMGGSPSLVVIAAADYGTFFGAANGILGLGGNDPQQAGLSIAGSRVVISSNLAAGEALVLDAGAVVAIEHSASPVALIDVKARSNSVDVVVEILAACFVASPDLAVHVKTK